MKSLKERIAEDKVLLGTVVFNPLMAILAERAGFDALYLGGNTLGLAKGVIEANLNLTEMVQAGSDIRTVTDAPLLLDAAAGWGDAMHMHRTVSMSEAAGFSAIEIEDQVLPKRAHHHIGVEHMIPQDLMAAKIEEAADARRSEDFVIIGRTNGIRNTGMDDALRRGEAYKKAGADMLMLFPRNPEEVRHVHERLGGPFYYNVPHGGLSGFGLTLDEMATYGCRILTDSVMPLIAAYKAWRDCYAATAGTLEYPDLPRAEVDALEEELFDVIGIDKLIEIEKRTVEKE
ncbi:MAG: carboxyvinyl-carboxyphosphonate phosphorylmutase [Rhodospirillaceae bacterium]|nr:carboxyvinyl-carboxyphosphonate phosphorylmutase [Rhodospirillaceae bacterium]